MGISVDDLETVTKFKASLKAEFPFLSDDDATVAKRYGVYDAGRDFAKRVTFVVGEGGTITHVERDKLDAEGVIAACPIPTPSKTKTKTGK